MNALQKLEGLLGSCQGASSMWERQALLAAFYDTGILNEVVTELSITKAKPKKQARRILEMHETIAKLEKRQATTLEYIQQAQKEILSTGQVLISLRDGYEMVKEED